MGVLSLAFLSYLVAHFPKMQQLEIYFIRHGETTANRDDILVIFNPSTFSIYKFSNLILEARPLRFSIDGARDIPSS